MVEKKKGTEIEENQKKSKKELLVDFEKGFYVNGSKIGFDEDEFFIEFFQTPAKPNGHYAGVRLYMIPDYAIKFHKTFGKSINGYKNKFKNQGKKK